MISTSRDVKYTGPIIVIVYLPYMKKKSPTKEKSSPTTTKEHITVMTNHFVSLLLRSYYYHRDANKNWLAHHYHIIWKTPTICSSFSIIHTTTTTTPYYYYDRTIVGSNHPFPKTTVTSPVSHTRHIWVPTWTPTSHDRIVCWTLPVPKSRNSRSWVRKRAGVKKRLWDTCQPINIRKNDDWERENSAKIESMSVCFFEDYKASSALCPLKYLFFHHIHVSLKQ